MAINVFLGIETAGVPAAAATQARLLGSPITLKERLTHRPYREWYDPKHLEPLYSVEECTEGLCNYVWTKADYWNEYYRPRILSSLGKQFTVNMSSSAHLPG